jgi:hypothetical protein
MLHNEENIQVNSDLDFDLNGKFEDVKYSDLNCRVRGRFNVNGYDAHIMNALLVNFSNCIYLRQGSLSYKGEGAVDSKTIELGRVDCEPTIKMIVDGDEFNVYYGN